MMKSWLSWIKSSVRPCAFKSSPKCSLHSGSKASRVAKAEGAGAKTGGALYPLTLPDLLSRVEAAGARGDSGGVGADE